jgi:hypothetical protein
VNDYLRSKNPDMLAWDIGGQLRARYEMKEYFATPGLAGAVDFRDNGGNPHNHYMLLREKVHVGYTQPWWNVYVEARDSSSHGDERDPNPEADVFDLHQAYFGIGNRKENPFSVKIGRQELSYGDERLVGAFDWNNLGRVFDAAKVRFENKDFWVDAFASRVVLVDDNSFNMGNEYETFWGLYGSTKTLIPKQETQLYFLARNTETKSPFAHVKDVPQAGGVSERDIYTPGLRVKSLPGAFGGWDYGAEIMGQFGRYTESAGTLALAKARKSMSHEAFAAYVGGGYTFTNVWATPRVGAEYNYASGDDDPTDKKHRTFDNLYPTNHKFYGMMDFVSLQNIHNVRFMTSVKPLKQLTLSLDYHLFWLAETDDSFYTVAGARRGGATPQAAAARGTGYGINSGYDSFVGSELDFVATYAITPYAIAQLGYGHFFVGDYVKSSLSAPTIGSHDADYTYLQMTFNF